MNGHQFQQMCCEKGQGPILNAACKEDPAKLGERYGAINLDIWTIDEQTNTQLSTIPNFQQGDVLDMKFEDGHFGTVVLGEFLEHCTYNAARDALLECKRVLKDDGWLVVTYPLDGRAPGMQHAARLLKVIVEGESGQDITVWHQHVWEEDEFAKLLVECGLEIGMQNELTYSFVVGWFKQTGRKGPHGWGRILKKVL